MRAADKIVARREMVLRSESAKLQGQTVVFTNGCFDLLHPGHVSYLEGARSLGSVLFVGLNSDESVRLLKGAGRPYMTEDDRALLIAGLEAVTLVTMFGEDTAIDLIEHVRPDVFAKGGDYDDDPASPDYPIEGGAVSSYGGRVCILPLAPGYSSTSMVEKIRAAATSQ
jgi:rfaE bifunctional protein nucleotidyltransferase chain/domain